MCGGTGCGSIPGTKVDDWCVSNSIVSGVYYTKGGETPCILVNNTNTAAMTVTALPFSSLTPIDGDSKKTDVLLILRGFNVFINLNLLCVCVFFPFILDVKFVGCTSQGHAGGRSHRISRPPSFCGACLLIFLARRIQSFLSFVNREVEFCALTI